ncbi:MAG: tetratricopeptide repeat protein [Deltaproteobacteria bacterium]|nr:tetratricopeptide repeat protein [Deltaproteobacteria bacterium]
MIAVLALGCIAWLDPYATAREGNRLLAAGKYEEATAKYNEALVDQPDSPQLHFNQGVAAYKQGKYDDALKAFQQVPTSDDDLARTARVAFSMGNTKAKLAEAAESSDPKAALSNYAEALALYRRAMGAAPDDLDSKFNHELVEKKLADLKKKLEEQQKEKQDQQQQNEQNQDQQQQDQQKQDQQNSGDKQDQQGEQKDQQQAEPSPDKEDKKDQQQAGGGAAEQAEKKDGELSKQEAAAVLDSQRDQEVQPGDVIKKLQGAVVGEPAQDW